MEFSQLNCLTEDVLTAQRTDVRCEIVSKHRFTATNSDYKDLSPSRPEMPAASLTLQVWLRIKKLVLCCNPHFGPQ